MKTNTNTLTKQMLQDEDYIIKDGYIIDTIFIGKFINFSDIVNYWNELHYNKVDKINF